LSYSTAAGQADVAWPRRLRLLVSADNTAWHYLGDVVKFPLDHAIPPATGYSLFRYVAHGLATHGRYVRLIVYPEGFYTFCDEIEIYRGDDSLMNQPLPGAAITDISAFLRQIDIQDGFHERMQADVTQAQTDIRASNLSATQQQSLLDRLTTAAKSIDTLSPGDLTTFKAVVPFNATHAQIYAVYGALWRTLGYPTLWAWKKHRYDPLTPHQVSAAGVAPPTIALSLLGGECRSEAFLLTNAADTAVQAKMVIRGVPGAPTPKWLQVASAPWTDTRRHQLVATALPVISPVAGVYTLNVPAGMTVPVWLTVSATGIAVGSYSGSITITGNNRTLTLPFQMKISGVAMARPRPAKRLACCAKPACSRCCCRARSSRWDARSIRRRGK